MLNYGDFVHILTACIKATYLNLNEFVINQLSFEKLKKILSKNIYP